jgi:hypothetical protein
MVGRLRASVESLEEGVWILGEPVSAGALLALACVALGLWLAHRAD